MTRSSDEFIAGLLDHLQEARSGIDAYIPPRFEDQTLQEEVIAALGALVVKLGGEPDERLVSTIPEAAKIAGVSENTIGRGIKLGKLKAHSDVMGDYPRPRWLIYGNDLWEFRKSLRNTQRDSTLRSSE